MNNESETDETVILFRPIGPQEIALIPAIGKSRTLFKLQRYSYNGCILLFMCFLLREVLMPKRPHSHKIEELSRGRLRDFFGQRGWVVWDLHPDYGEDLLVRVFIEEKATHYSFFVQAKATDHIDRYISRDREYISFPIDVDHLGHWKRFWEPVILTVWDAVSDITYWEIVQDYLEDNDRGLRFNKVLVNIPITNVLDDNGLMTILERTIIRFHRFEWTCEGVSALINYMEKYFHANVIYQPGERQMLVIRDLETAKINTEQLNTDSLDLKKLNLEVSNVQGSLFISTMLGMDFIIFGEVAERFVKEAEIAKMTLPEFLSYFIETRIRKSSSL